MDEIKVDAIYGDLSLVHKASSIGACRRCVLRDNSKCHKSIPVSCSSHTFNGYFVNTTPELVAEMAKRRLLGNDND